MSLLTSGRLLRSMMRLLRAWTVLCPAHSPYALAGLQAYSDRSVRMAATFQGTLRLPLLIDSLVRVRSSMSRYPSVVVARLPYTADALYPTAED